MKAHYNKAKFSVAQKKAMNEEIRRQLAEYDQKHAVELAALVLWVLHSEFGFGEKRLRRFYDSFFPAIDELIQRYMLEDDKDVFICTLMLKRAGIDIEQWEIESR